MVLLDNQGDLKKPLNFLNFKCSGIESKLLCIEFGILSLCKATSITVKPGVKAANYKKRQVN